MKYNVTLKPGSKKGPLVIEDHDWLVIYLREKPIEGAANAALIKLLAEYFQVSKSQVEIKVGLHSRQKIVEIIK